jgi:hypothetical protein
LLKKNLVLIFSIRIWYLAYPTDRSILTELKHFLATPSDVEDKMKNESFYLIFRYFK